MEQRRRVPPITRDDVTLALAQRRELSGFSIDNNEKLAFLKCAFHNGQTGTISLSPAVADHLLRHLEILIYGAERTPERASPIRWAKLRVAKAYGYGLAPKP